MRSEQVTVAPSVFRANPKYIRIRTNQDHVRTLADVLEENKEWPFPPVKVHPIPVSEIKETERYFIIDGHHRVEAALLTKRNVVADVFSGMTEADVVSMQVSENAKHGMILDVRARQTALTYLQEAGMKQAEIVKRTGLSKASVSRILAGKSQVTAGTDKDARKGPQKKGGKPFNAEGWFKSLGKLLVGWEKHRRKIEKYSGFPEGCEKILDKLADHFSPESE